MRRLQIERLLSTSGFRWRITLAALLLLCAVAAWGVVEWHSARLRAGALALRVADRRSDAGIEDARERIAPLRKDFTGALPATIRVPEVVSAIQAACAKAAVALTGIQVQTRPSSASQLGRAELAVSLRGPYTAVRDVIDQVLARYVDVTPSRLNLRRLERVADVEASLTLSVWARPASSAGSSGEPKGMTRP